MRIHIIACRILTRELNWLAAQSEHQVDITWVGRGLHNTPEALRRRLYDEVENLYAQLESGELEYKPDYIVLERITQILPIRDNPNYDCVIEGRDYLVYSVDKK